MLISIGEKEYFHSVCNIIVFKKISLSCKNTGVDRFLKNEIQLTLDTFDPAGAPLCQGEPRLNRSRTLCQRCPHARRGRGSLVCSMFGLRIGVRVNMHYAGGNCSAGRYSGGTGYGVRCAGGPDHLHVHYIDGNRTNDHPENLITLCDLCHARAHAEMRIEGGAGKLKRMFRHTRESRETRGVKEGFQGPGGDGSGTPVCSGGRTPDNDPECRSADL